MSKELICRLVRNTITSMLAILRASPMGNEAKYPSKLEMRAMSQKIVEYYPMLRDPDPHMSYPHEDPALYLEKRPLSSPVLLFDGTTCIVAVGNIPCENFEEVSLCEEFLQLAEQELADILDQDDLTVTQEITVYQSILRWINHMPEERQGAISTLLPKVRLGPNAVLLMFRIYSKTIEAFDYRTNSWITVHTHPSLEDTMAHLLFYSTVFLGRCFYIVGGVLRWTDPSNRVWRFNLVTHTWQEMSPMQESRSFVSVTVLKGCIYAMGGYRDDGTSLRTAERYQPDINQWTFIASMNEERIRASCTTLNNKIYICGGRSNRVLNTAEYYNPDTNQWTLITPMGTPRCDLGVVAYMGHIFAVGGRDGFRDLRSAEAYDPVTNTWY
ncbi:kelch-like protein 10, partial [Gouania willdenowi]|uniref:kelch-like protein 10 n=1 Tax=Gouania willdenowi TaxID=441366 RepID=UPI0010544EAB